MAKRKRKCIVCGRPLKTGIKYCYVCRSLQKAKGVHKKRLDVGKTSILVIICLIVFVSLYSINSALSVFFKFLSLIIGFPLFIGLLGELSFQHRKRNSKKKSK